MLNAFLIIAFHYSITGLEEVLKSNTLILISKHSKNIMLQVKVLLNLSSNKCNEVQSVILPPKIWWSKLSSIK